MEAYVPFVYRRKKDYGSAKEFAKEVSKWMHAQKKANEYQNTAHQMAHQNAHNAMMMSFNLNQQGMEQGMGNFFGVGQNTVHFNIQAPRDPNWLRRYLWRLDSDVRVTENVIVASYSKRLLAELLDFFIFFFIKLGLLFLIVEVGYLDIQEYERFLTDEIDIQNLLDLSQGLLPADLLCKFISSIVEATMISFGLSIFPRGCTPGKFVMGIKIIDCVSIQPNQEIPGSYTIVRTEGVSFAKALARSFIKNFAISFFYPISCAAYVFPYNRAVYDVVAKTLVVQM
uniref:RDD domain-containing protein n=1 Tax=Strongyloides papillosus TaxID=174720 RepID=A0A0N5BBP8_STREA